MLLWDGASTLVWRGGFAVMLGEFSVLANARARQTDDAGKVALSVSCHYDASILRLTVYCGGKLNQRVFYI